MDAMRRTLIVTNDFPPAAAGFSPLCTRSPAGWTRAGRRLRAGLAGRGRVRRQAAIPRGQASDLADAAGAVRQAGQGGAASMAATPCCSAPRRRSGCWPQDCAGPVPAGRRPDPRSRGRLGGTARREGFVARIGDHVDVLTYLGEYFRIRLAKALTPAAAARMVRLAPGVDNESFRPGAGGAAIRARLGIAPPPVVVCVSRMVPRKGQDTLIEAWPRVLARRRAAAALLLVGDGPYAGHLTARASRRAGQLGQVFTGPVRWEDLPAYYDAGTIFAMPCRTRRRGLDVEGLGIVYLEASAAGLPVIGGDSGGAPDAILPGETGYVVGGRDVAALTERLVQLLRDPHGATTMGEKGIAWVDREWRWDLIAARLARSSAG